MYRLTVRSSPVWLVVLVTPLSIDLRAIAIT